MNICILKESMIIGGTERSAANTSEVISQDHKLWIALYDASQMMYSCAGNVIDFRLPPRNSTIGKIINTFLRDVMLRKLIKNKKIEILYTFTTIGNRQTRYKYDTIKIISARDFGAISKKHSTYFKALKNSSAMICNSEYTRQFFLTRYPEQSDKVYTVYNYINTKEIVNQAKERIDSQCAEFIERHSSTIVSVGRFCREKGFEYLIESVAHAREKDKDIGLVLVGDGEYRQKYLDLVEHFELQDYVYFTGFQRNPYKYMARCSCFVLSSRSEGFPNVLAEAMALGLPAIATNCYSGPAEILRKDADYSVVKDTYIECDYGILSPAFKDDDNQIAINELSNAMIKLLSDKQLCDKYRSLSAQRSLDFSEEATRNRLNGIFNMLKERRDAR